MSLNEALVENSALEWFGELGYAVGHGPQLAPGEPAAERVSFGEVVLVRRLREAIRRLTRPLPRSRGRRRYVRCCGWGRLRSRRRTALFTECCAMACR